MRPSGTLVLSFVAAFFAACALVLLLLQRVRGQRDRGAWLTFSMQLVLSAWLLVPAWLPAPWFLLAVAVVALAGVRELVALSRLGVVARGLASLGVLIGAAALVALQARGAAHFYFLYACVELNDALAFIVGRSIGRTKIFPELSPNKTLEGLVAGLVASSCAGFLLAGFEPEWSPVSCALAGFALACGAVIADLAASSLKRRAGVKDFSQLLPGHGGALDAYDSLLQVAPWFLALIAGLG